MEEIMSLEELITSLAGEAEAEKEKILREAEGTAARILEQARAEIEKSGHGPKSEAARKLSTERAKRLHAAKARGEGLVRQAKQEIIDAVARKVLQLAEDLPKRGDYAECLKALVAESTDGLAGGTVQVRPQDLKAASEAAAGLPNTFQVVPEKGMAVGVRVVSEDGLVEVDNTFPTRLKKFLSLKESEVAAMAFPVEPHA